MPTGRDLSGYAAGWRKRIARRREADTRRAAWVRERLPAVVDLLAREYGVTRIVLFGSFARGEGTQRSDLDLLVEGLDPQRWTAACTAIDRLLGGIHADLVPKTDARPFVLERAEIEGEVLYDTSS